MVLPRAPFIASYIQFPRRTTGVFHFHDTVAVVMDKLLWFYSPFTNHRQVTAGLVHFEYEHTHAITCVGKLRVPSSYAAAAIPDAFDPSPSIDTALLLLDERALFSVINLPRSFVCARFEAPNIAAAEIREIRGSLIASGEFAVLTPTQVLICQHDLGPRREGAQILHRHDICAQSIREFGSGYLALHDHDLLFLDGAECSEYFPRNMVNAFAIDGTAVVTVARASHKSEAEFQVVNGPSFRVGKLVAFDAADEYIVVLLKCWVLVVVNRVNLAQRMHVQIGANNVAGFDKHTKIVCGTMKDSEVFSVNFFCNENQMSIHIPEPLFRDTDECVEEDEEEL
jgi:hypothetical protein